MEPLSANDPRTVGEYQLRSRLGAGGMGRVYLGFSPAGRAVAVKVVHPELARDAEFRHRFGREVAAARAVSGMYTASVVGAGVDEEQPWLATAYVPGPSLADVVVRHGPLPELAVWRLAAGLTEALRAVHACGLVHRDLKPANVLLAADGPRLIDFGISRAFEGTVLTTVGTVVGTPGYMSPEQAEGAQVGPASDVFSLGCVLAFAASGNAPFGVGSAASVLYRVVNGQPDLAGVPRKLRQVITLCLAKVPAQRPELPALAARITRAAPTLTASPTSFWPAQVAAMVQDEAPGAPAPNGMAQDGYQAAATAKIGKIGGLRPDRRGARPDRGDARPGAPGAPGGPGGPARPGGPGGPGAGAAAGAPGAKGKPPFAAGVRDVPAAPPRGQAGPAPPWVQPPQGDALARYPAAPQQPGRPTAVVTAVSLMYGGAFMSVLAMIIDLVVISQLKTSYLSSHPDADPNAVGSVAGGADIGVIVASVISLIVWMVLAGAAKRGRKWVRTAGTVLFSIDTIAYVATVGQSGIPAIKTVHLLIWLIGLLAVIFLWQRSSARYFSAARQRRLPIPRNVSPTCHSNLPFETGRKQRQPHGEP